jgi:hypothetical protein
MPDGMPLLPDLFPSKVDGIRRMGGNPKNFPAQEEDLTEARGSAGTTALQLSSRLGLDLCLSVGAEFCL